MKVLVTGGAGYIGSVVVEQLVRAGESVVVLDNLSQGHREAVDPAAGFVMADLLDRPRVDAILARERPDAVMHFAARSQVGESMRQPFLYLRDNIVGGMNLIESAADHGVRRFILSSTANLYDRPTHMPIPESEPVIPGSPYGESKWALERLLHWCDRLYGMRFATLRYFNAAGATARLGEDHRPELHLIPLVLQVALGQRERITIFGDDYRTPDGTCIRDYVHVSDLAQAHLLALGALDRGSRTYNVGNGLGFSVREVLAAAREVTGHPIPAETGPRRAGDPPVLVAASQQIRDELGWRPQFADLREIVVSAWEWHRRHPAGYRTSANVSAPVAGFGNPAFVAVSN